MKNTYLPEFYRTSDEDQKFALRNLIDGRNPIVFDEIYSQLKELVKIQNPSKQISDAEYQQLIDDQLKSVHVDDFGVWVYYPWSNALVHLLDEEEFVEVRTNRNRNKITREEQSDLKTKIIGVAGLSVGQSIAITLVMERVCGEIRLADFDTAELSNLNRIRTGVQNLGLNKAVIAAREIAEIDPFIKVRIFNDGLQQHNMEAFFSQGGLLDLYVEVCDGIQMKLTSRFKARQLAIPVVMDTNDRGMLDVERFDLEPDRGILHGKLDEFIVDNSITVSDDNRMRIVNSILNFDTLSERMKLSMTEIGKTINTWPQLASSVVLGGAITTDICRRILLGHHKESARYYVDLEAIFKENE